MLTKYKYLRNQIKNSLIILKIKIKDIITFNKSNKFQAFRANIFKITTK